MAISQLPQAPYRQDRKTFPTALSTDVIFSEIRDCSRINFPEYGTPHPSAAKWPDHKLVFIKTVDIERDGIFEFFYAADRENQDLYNFAFGFRNIIGNVGGREFRTIQRTYVTARESFAPYDIPFGTAMPNIPEDKFEGVDYVFFDRQQQKIDIAELDSLYVIEVHTYVETAFLEYKLSYSAQRDDGLPERFKVQIPQEQTEEIVEGFAEMPVLAAGELSSSEDQLNPDVKLVKKVTRNIDSTPVLTGKIVTNVLQVAGVEESIVDDGETIVASALTVDGSVESLGNGKSVKRVITAPDLFKAESFSAQRPDAVPEKFRVAIPTTTVEENVEGTATQPILTTGELVASEQQVNKFVKRTQKTKRNPNGPTVLTEKATDNTKLLATVTETYQTGDTTVTPSALVDVTSQALGDGTYIVRTIEVPQVFAAQSFASERPDVTPPKFRAAIPTETTEESIAGTAAQPTLVAGELAATEEQVNVFVKRKRKTKRNATSSTTLTEKATDNTKQLATITETYQTGDTTLTPSATVEITSEALGDGTYVVRKVEVPQVFSAQSFASERPDVTPPKFRAAIPTETTEESIAGTAAQPTLVAGELAATEEQVNIFVKRKRKTKRNVTSSTTLTEKATDNTKQLATITETYQTGDTTLTPSATVEITSEALGDGTYVVRKVQVPEVFRASILSVEKPDFIPLKFQATIPSVTTDVTEAGTAVLPSLSGDDLAVSEQQVNKFVKRTQRKTRAIPSNATLAGSEFSQAISYVTSEELVDIGTPSATGSTVVESSVTPIGGGKALRTVKSVANGAYSSSNPATRRIENRVTPLETDIIFIEIGAMPVPAPEYGTPHYSPNQWPNHKLVLIKPAGRDGILYEFYYAADRENQDDYNLVDQNNGQFLIRSYIIPRADFYNRAVYALTVPIVGVSPDPVFGADDPIYGDFVFSGESVKHTGTELDSLYIEVERTYQLKEEVTYDFNNNLEVNFKITKRIVARDTPTTANEIGKIVERQNINAWLDIETITELDGRNNYFDANGKFIPIVLPDVPKDVQFNFPNLLNSISITIAPSDSSTDHIIDYNMVSPPSGPFEARVMRIITDDPDYYRTLYPVVNLHPKRELINTSATSYSGDSESGFRSSTSCRQTEVPASVHGDIDIDVDFISQMAYRPSFWDDVTNVVTDVNTNLSTVSTVIGFPLFQVNASLPKTSDFYRLTGGGEIVVGYDVTKVDLNLYNVSVIFLNIDGLYTGDADSAYDGRTRQQVFLSGTIPCRLSYTLAYVGNAVNMTVTADLFEFRLQSPSGDILDTGFTQVASGYLGAFSNNVGLNEAIQQRLTVMLLSFRMAYVSHVVRKLKASYLIKSYSIRSTDSSITLKSLATVESPQSITMSFYSNYATVSSYLGGNVLIPRGGGPTITSTSTIIPS